jgi:hypothetical protein
LSARRTSKGIYSSEDDLMMSLSIADGDDRGRGVTGAERVSLVADVTLRSIPDDVL